jgi:hydroxypyruvate isomerase
MTPQTLPLATRRNFLAAAGAGAAAAIVSSRSAAQDTTSTAANTWLTYAVNIEMTFSKLPVLDRLRKVAEAGFTHYEFWQWKPKDIDAMVRLNKELGLTPTQFSSFWGITHPSKKEAFLESVRGCIAPAEKLGVKKLCVVAGEEAEGLTREEQDRAVIDALKAGGEILKPHGITLILEPLNILVDHPKQLIVDSAHAVRVLKAVDMPNVRMLFDIYHQQISEGNLILNIRKHKDYIGYFQLADNPGRHEPGTGEINYARVLRAIHDMGYKGAIGLEMSPAGDAMAALGAVRKVDAAAKAL